MDTTKDSLAVIDYIKSKGYENYTGLNKWVTEIIENREKFKRLYKDGTSSKHGRPEKYLVKKEAQTLIDNLCILYSFKNLFGRAGSDEKNVCSAYRFLKNKSNKSILKQKVLELQKKLESQKKLNDKALETLSIFFSAIQGNMPMDITCINLGELMHGETGNKKIIDLSDSYQIGAWNELTQLKNTLNEKGENSEIYQKIGEVLYELGDKTGAIEALKQATDLNPENGVAWAIKAIIFRELLVNSNRKFTDAFARMEFQFIENPIEPEEQCMNECIEDTFSNTEDLHESFVESCFFALQYWPLWVGNNHYTDMKGNEKKNYCPNINLSNSCRCDVSRGWLFFHLVLVLCKTDMIETRKIEFINILKSFQSYNSSFPYLIFSPFSLEANNTTHFKPKFPSYCNEVGWQHPKFE